MDRMIKRYLARRRQAVLCLDIELVLTRAVAEIRDKLAIGRPCGIAFGGSARICQTPYIALFRGNGKDLAAGLDQHALACRRYFQVANAARDILPTRHHPWEISGDVDRHNMFLAALGIELMDIAGLFENYRTRARIHRLDIEIAKLCKLAQLF